MAADIKALFVVLVIDLLIFQLAKPFLLQFSKELDYARRRNVWLILTTVAFFSPSFWFFCLPAVPLILWAVKKDTNPVAFYMLMLFVIPQINISIPIVGINQLFGLDIYRLLALLILIPLARQWRAKSKGDPKQTPLPELFLLGFGVLQIVFYIPADLPNHIILSDSITNVLRRAFLYFLDVYVLYFVMSRYCRDRRILIESMAAFCLACVLMSGIAIFESAKRWLLYATMFERWTGRLPLDFYLMRGDILRAQASAGHSIALGFLIAIAIGLWLYLRTATRSMMTQSILFLLLWIGLLVAYARGPWLGAVIICLLYVAFRPRAMSGIIKAALFAGFAASLIVISPLGRRITSVLPVHSGGIDNDSIIYRQLLAARSWELILQHPLFGDHLAYSDMASLRQGEGIIDFVNSYAQVTVFYGFSGLVCFAGFLLLPLAQVILISRKTMRAEPDTSILGASLAACMTGALVMIAGCSFILGIEKLYFVLGGFASAFVTSYRFRSDS